MNSWLGDFKSMKTGNFNWFLHALLFTILSMLFKSKDKRKSCIKLMMMMMGLMMSRKRKIQKHNTGMQDIESIKL